MNKVLTWIDKSEANINEIPQKQGVYLIACNCKDGGSRVIYTGQTDNLWRRTNEHWSDSEKNEDLKNALVNYKGAFKITYAEVDTTGDLDGIERFLFNHYQPQFTDRAPDADSIEVSLPNSVVKGTVKF